MPRGWDQYVTAGTTPAGTESMRQSEKARRAHFGSAPAFRGFLPSVDKSFTPIFGSPSRPQLVRRAVRRNNLTPAKNPEKNPDVPVRGCPTSHLTWTGRGPCAERHPALAEQGHGVASRLAVVVAVDEPAETVL